MASLTQMGDARQRLFTHLRRRHRLQVYYACHKIGLWRAPIQCQPLQFWFLTLPRVSLLQHLLCEAAKCWIVIRGTFVTQRQCYFQLECRHSSPLNDRVMTQESQKCDQEPSEAAQEGIFLAVGSILWVWTVWTQNSNWESCSSNTKVGGCHRQAEN